MLLPVEVLFIQASFFLNENIFFPPHRFQFINIYDVLCLHDQCERLTQTQGFKMLN